MVYKGNPSPRSTENWAWSEVALKACLCTQTRQIAVRMSGWIWPLQPAKADRHMIDLAAALRIHRKGRRIPWFPFLSSQQPVICILLLHKDFRCLVSLVPHDSGWQTVSPQSPTVTHTQLESCVVSGPPWYFHLLELFATSPPAGLTSFCLL